MSGAHEHSHDNHDHQHQDHDHIPNNKKVLLISFLLISGFMCIEFIGGLMTNSLALLSDAMHMLSDAVALGIALFATIIAQKAISTRKSFGYHRFEILAAALNGITLIAVSIYICVEALSRFQQPENIGIMGMLIISSIGLLVNIVVAWFILKNSDTENDLNMQSAYLHVLSDLLGSIGAITAALCLYFFGWEWADPLISIFVALLVLRSGYLVLRKAAHVLMQGTPEQFNLEQIQQKILQYPHISQLHDVHLWTLNSKKYIFSCHIVVDEQLKMADLQPVLNQLEQYLLSLGIQHITIHTETAHAIHHAHCTFMEHDHEQQPPHSHHH